MSTCPQHHVASCDYSHQSYQKLEFYDMLSPNLQPLETMGKIREVNGYVRMTLVKLEWIRGDLVRIDDG